MWTSASVEHSDALRQWDPYLIAEQQLAKMQTGSIKKILKRIQIELDFVKYSEKMGYRNWFNKTHPNIPPHWQAQYTWQQFTYKINTQEMY